MMIWITIADLLGLIYLSTKLQSPARKRAFRKAWIAFVFIPVSHFFMNTLRASNAYQHRTLEKIDFWDQAIPYLILGISLLFLVGALAPRDECEETDAK